MAITVKEPVSGQAPPAAGPAPLPADSMLDTVLLPSSTGPAVLARSSVGARVRTSLRLAYANLGSKEHHILLECIIWMVIASVVVTVLQHDPAMDAQYHDLFRVAETLILLVFAADYSFNLYYASSRRGYALSFAGIVDLLAILPSFLVFVDTSSIKFLRSLRFLRFLRILQVVKAMQHRQQLQGTEDETSSLLLDLQLGVIGISALLLLVPDDALRNLLLTCTLTVAVTTGIRRWLVFRQMPTLSIVVLLISLVGAAVWAIQLDVQGHGDWAVWVLVGTVVVGLVTWFQVEAPAGI